MEALNVLFHRWEFLYVFGFGSVIKCETKGQAIKKKERFVYSFGYLSLSLSISLSVLKLIAEIVVFN